MVVLFKLTVFESQTINLISLLQQSLVTVRNVYSAFSKTRPTINKAHFLVKQRERGELLTLK